MLYVIRGDFSHKNPKICILISIVKYDLFDYKTNKLWKIEMENPKMSFRRKNMETHKNSESFIENVICFYIYFNSLLLWSIHSFYLKLIA